MKLTARSVSIGGKCLSHNLKIRKIDGMYVVFKDNKRRISFYSNKAAEDYILNYKKSPDIY